MSAIAAIAAAAALLAVTAATSEPTGSEPVDALYRAAFAVVGAIAGSRSRRWSLVWGSALVVVAGGLPFQAAAVLGVLAASAMMIGDFRHRVLGAGIGGVIALGALTLERPEATGATALVAAAACGPLLVSAYRRTGRGARTAVRITCLTAVVVTLAGLAAAGVFATTERARIESAATQTRSAVAQATEDPDMATREFNSASDSFDSIEAATSQWWLLPARATPVIGANIEFVRAAAGTGAELNSVAAELSESLANEDLRDEQGGVDLAALSAVNDVVQRATREIARSAADLEDATSPWLIGPVRTAEQEMEDALHDAGGSARTAALAAERLPHLLGADGPRRYLMLLGNPAESRDLGGHIGNWAEVIAQDGRLSVVEVGAPYDLAGPATSPALRLTPGQYPQSLLEMRPQNFPQNWGATADLPTVARLAAELYPQVRPGPPLDGVIYADPSAFAALLTFTGAQAIPGTDIVLTPDNAAEFLSVGQYEVFADERAGNAAVSGLIDDVVGSFGAAQLPPPADLAAVLGPAVRRGSLQFASLDPDDQPLLDRLGLSGSVERPGSGDLLAILTRNANPSKIDVYLRRTSRYIVNWDPVTGRVDATVQVTLTNSAPAEGLPDVVGNTVSGLPTGTNRVLLSILSPWTAQSASLDGEPVNVGTQQELRGVLRHSMLVDVAPGETRSVDLSLSGTVGPEVPYLLQIVGQPTTTADTLTIEVYPSTGSRQPEAGDERTSVRVRGDQDKLLTVPNPTR